MIEQIINDIFRIEVPLPKNPLRTINAYVIRDTQRSLIIDTGMNRKECRNALLAGLAEIGVSPDKADFFITHMHADHCGLVTSLTTDAPNVYCSLPASIDIARLSKDEYWDEIRTMGNLSGFTGEALRAAVSNHPGNKFCPRGKINFRIVKDGDVISVGGYQLTCIETPGHTTGHVCLYETNKKLLFSGDHILTDITPNISLGTSYKHDLLAEYMANLDRIAGLDISLVLPGHRSLIDDCRGRIQELKEHHCARAEQVLDILKDTGGSDAYFTASKMTWDMTYESWELFPVMQKWFACGEALAHLKYLEVLKILHRKKKEGKYFFSLLQPSIGDRLTALWQ